MIEVYFTFNIQYEATCLQRSSPYDLYITFNIHALMGLPPITKVYLLYLSVITL